MRREISRILLNGFYVHIDTMRIIDNTTIYSWINLSSVDIMMMNDDAVEQGYNNLLISKMSSEFIEI